MNPILIDLADRPELVPTVAAWHQEAFGYLNPHRSLDERIERLRPHLRQGAIPTTFVAVEDRTPVGCASLVEDDMSIRPELTPWLAGVYVVPERRGNGIGATLVRRVVATARTTPAATLHLYTLDRMTFYQGLGWQKRERTPYLGFDVVVMTIDVASRN